MYGASPGFSNLEAIDRQLGGGSHGINGFCRELGLPYRQGNLATSFQVSAELPAMLISASWSKGVLDLVIESLGSPRVTIEWLPQHELQGVPVNWDAENREIVGKTQALASLPVPIGSTAAKLILSFGELQAEAITIDLSSPRFDLESQLIKQSQLVKLYDVAEVPVLPDSGCIEGQDQQPSPAVETRKGHSQQQTTDSATSEAGGRRNPRKLRRYRSEVKKAIFWQLFQNPKATNIQICQGLDADGASPPEGYKDDPDHRFYEKAYEGTDEGLKHYIQNSIDEVKADLRLIGWL
jgi:hypothetical protein